ncbi:NAALAD2 [Branchiostoma lanceolatum]|uniref:NAALAD2 protein n=1 Tax=Branchiostoma lanceolatum TaxID=7740 RepID=A0A8J9ZHB9_BRALA|nr:NAALAD2 [Branchiostoma lanceolatum]
MVVLVLCLWMVIQVYVVTTQMQDGEKIPYRCFGQAGSFGWSGDCACSSMLPWAMDNSIPQTNQQLVDQMQNIKARLDQLEAVTAQITSSGNQKTGPAATDSRLNSRVDSRVDSTATTASAVQTTAGAATSSTVGSNVAISDGPQPSAIYTATPTQAVAALPIPRYYWDLSGKCNPQGSSQKQCNKSCRSKMVYANTGNRTGVTSGSLYLVANARSGASSTSNLPPCAIKTDRKRKDFIDFGSFRGTCPAQPELCQDGLSLAVWMKMKRKDNTYGDGQNPDLYFISTGGQTRSSRGFAVSAEWISMPSVAYRWEEETYVIFYWTILNCSPFAQQSGILTVSGSSAPMTCPTVPGFTLCSPGTNRQCSRIGTLTMSKGRYILLAVLCGAVAFALGVIIGWFSRSELTAEDLAALQKYWASVEDADETIRDNILTNIDAERIRENLRELSRKPHMAGTPQDHEMAELLKRRWLENGLDEVRLVPYDVLLSYPPLGREGPNNTVVTVDGADPAREFEDTRSLHIEPEYQDDPDAVQFFNAYSPPGHPVGDLVFANYGRLEDFDYLREVGVDCTGKIVLMKYRSAGRGVKAKNAAAAGAIGAILYPEPADTNAPGGKIYPEGWDLPGTGTERGGSLLESGDPLTPGYPATDYAYRLPEGNISVFPPIPLQPIGYNDAQKYLSHLDGDVAPAGWNGTLPITYRLGPGFTGDWAGRKVALHVYTNTTIRRVYNVVGMIKGRVEPDRYVMLGNHYDSWVQGAIDDTSSTAMSLELTRVFGGLVKDGTWRPRRSIVFVAWGAEEFGLLGSHEYVEQFTDLIKERVVAYINMDIGVGGNYTVFGGCSPSMVDVIYDATKQVPDPDASLGKSIYETWAERAPTNTDADVKVPRLDWPRVNTDYIPFGLRVGTPLFTFAYVHDQGS